MSQNIIDVSWDLEKFDLQTQAVIKNLEAVYELSRKVSETAIKPGSTGGYTELKQKMAEFNKSQEDLIAKQKEIAASSTNVATALNNQTSSLERNIQTRIRLQNSMESYIASQKEDLDLLKKNVITRDEYNKRFIESQAKVERYKTEISALNKNIKEQTLTTEQQGGAYAILNKEYLLAQTNAKNNKTEEKRSLP